MILEAEAEAEAFVESLGTCTLPADLEDFLGKSSSSFHAQDQGPISDNTAIPAFGDPWEDLVQK